MVRDAAAHGSRLGERKVRQDLGDVPHPLGERLGALRVGRALQQPRVVLQERGAGATLGEQHVVLRRAQDVQVRRRQESRALAVAVGVRREPAAHVRRNRDVAAPGLKQPDTGHHFSRNLEVAPTPYEVQ